MSPRVNLIQDTAAGFVTKNPILRAGDLGIETDTGLSKFGDGINSWTALPYYPYDSSSGLFRNQLAVSSGSVLGTIPGRVHPAERLLKEAVWWIDAKHSTASGQSVRNLGWGGSALNAQLGSSGSADSNDPQYLAWTGENYVYLPGASNNNISVPATGLDYRDDLHMQVTVALDSYTADGTLMSQWDTSSMKFRWFIAVGTMRWAETQSATEVQRLATADMSSLGLQAGQIVTFEVKRTASTGQIVFRYSTNGGVSWTQIGNALTGYTGSLDSSTASWRLGTYGGSGFPAAGKFYRGILKDGIDGTPVLDIDCSQITSGGATSFRALTGQTVTINRSTSGRKAVAVTQPCWLFGSDDYMQVADNDLLDMAVSQGFTALAVSRTWATPTTSQRLLSKQQASGYSEWVLRNSTTTYSPLFAVADTDTVVAVVAPESTSGSVRVEAGVYDTRAVTVTAFLNGIAGASSSTSAITTDMGNTSAMTVGRTSNTASSYADMEGIAFAIFRRALTSAEIALLNTYYQSRG